ncbi:unnamed protein product [Musa textilis]
MIKELHPHVEKNRFSEEQISSRRASIDQQPTSSYDMGTNAGEERNLMAAFMHSECDFLRHDLRTRLQC